LFNDYFSRGSNVAESYTLSSDLVSAAGAYVEIVHIHISVNDCT